MIHQLKTESQYFEAVLNGTKTFEVRNNDRKFEVGDYLALNEITDHKCNLAGERLETGDCTLVKVVYVLKDCNFVQDGFAILGIRPCNITTRKNQICEIHK